LATWNTKGSTFDTILGVYTGSELTNLTLVAGNDDSGNYLTSKVKFYATVGTPYAIAVDGRGSNGVGEIVLSLSVDTTAEPIPVFTLEPADTAVPLGQPALLTTAVSVPNSPFGPAGVSYQWYRNGWLVVPGATNSTLLIPAVTAADIGLYNVQVTDAEGFIVHSQEASVEIGYPGNHSYIKLQDLIDALAGLPSKLTKLDAGFQSVSVGTLGQLTVNNGKGRASQDSCYDICNNAIYLGFAPASDGTFLVDDSCSSSCTTFADVVLDIYQYDSGSYNPIACATRDPVLGFAHASFPATAGGDYVVEIDGANNMSGTVQVNYQFGVPPASGILAPLNLTVKELSSFTLISDITNGAVSQPSYQWYFNSNLMSGATATNYTDPAAQFTDAGAYSVEATNAFGSTGLVPVATVTVPAYLPAPTLNTPLGGGLPGPVPSFSWTQVSGATGYNLVVATESVDLPTQPESASGGPSIVVNTNMIGNPSNPGASIRLDANTTYYWEVQASNSAQWGTWSEIRTFSTPVPAFGLFVKSISGGAFNLSLTELTMQAIVDIYNSTNLGAANWNFLTNSTNAGSVWNLSFPTNALPAPQFFKAVEH
jgi:hypothetical protein